jgi:hypothetical protein
MTMANPEAMRAAGYCTHGNIPSTCPKCGSRREGMALKEKAKKHYGVEDVKAFQQALVAFNDLRKKDGVDYSLSEPRYYEYATTGALSDEAPPEALRERQERMAGEKTDGPAYESFKMKAFRFWKRNLLANAEKAVADRPKLKPVIDLLSRVAEPTTWRELRALIGKHPELNDFGALEYQDGLEGTNMLTNPFLHVRSDRLYGYAHEKPKGDLRIYLNPPKEAMPKLADRFAELAEKGSVPFYFKMIDFSLQKPSLSDSTRLDRFLFYADKETAPKVVEIIEQIRREHPDWFENRALPPLAAKASEGIAVAENPNEAQRRLMGGGTSFNEVRAKFMAEVWRDGFAEALLTNPDIRPRGGRTFKELFLDELKPEEKKYANDMVMARFNVEKMPSEEAKRAYEEVIPRLMSKTAAFLDPEALARYVQKQIPAKAKKYFIDPDNIAFNAA